MRHSYFYSFICSLLLLSACSGEKASDEKISTLYIGGSTRHYDGDYTSEACKPLFKNPKVLKLETNEKCLLGGFISVVDITPKYVIIGDRDKIHFFDAKSGAYLSKIDRRGDGPEEYSNAYTRYFDREKEVISIATGKKIKSYKPDGTFVNEIPNDSLSNFTGVADGYWGVYEREYQKEHIVAFFDRNWKKKRSFFPDADADSASSHTYFIPQFREINNKVFFMRQDTLYTNKKDELVPALAIDQGNLKMPDDVLADFNRFIAEGQKYIQADKCFIVGNYAFYNFVWEKGMHYTLWNIKTGELLMHSKSGYDMPFDDKTTIKSFVASIIDNKVYALLPVDKLAKYGLANDEDDFNPWVLSLDLAE